MNGAAFALDGNVASRLSVELFRGPDRRSGDVQVEIRIDRVALPSRAMHLPRRSRPRRAMTAPSSSSSTPATASNNFSSSCLARLQPNRLDSLRSLHKQTTGTWSGR